MRTTHLLPALAAVSLLCCMAAQPTPAQQAPTLAGTEWELALLDGEPLPDDVEITLGLDGDRVSGSAPVNRYFAVCDVDGETLSFSEVVSTRIGGPPHLMAIEATYLGILREVRAWRIADGTLQLRDGAGTTRLVFTPADPTPDLVGSEWTLKLLDGEPPPDDAQITATFTEEQILGHAGVNQYFAAYHADRDALTFSEIGRTLMAGPDHLMAAENAYLQALEATRALRVMEGRLELIDAAGETRALFGLVREEMGDLEIIDPGAPVDLAENQLWVPMRAIARWLGATVSWDPATGTATAAKDGREFVVDTRRNVGRGGGLEWSTGYPMLQPSGLVYAPLDALTYSLGGKVIRQPDDHVLILEAGDRRGTLVAP
ncbi:MAG: META domain-containing protein [Armatimonadota bacterium]|jgi:heat shock protein HslJ